MSPQLLADPHVVRQMRTLWPSPPDMPTAAATQATPRDTIAHRHVAAIHRLDAMLDLANSVGAFDDQDRSQKCGQDTVRQRFGVLVERISNDRQNMTPKAWRRDTFEKSACWDSVLEKADQLKALLQRQGTETHRHVGRNGEAIFYRREDSDAFLTIHQALYIAHDTAALQSSERRKQWLQNAATLGDPSARSSESLAKKDLSDILEATLPSQDAEIEAPDSADLAVTHGPGFTPEELDSLFWLEVRGLCELVWANYTDYLLGLDLDMRKQLCQVSAQRCQRRLC